MKEMRKTEKFLLTVLWASAFSLVSQWFFNWFFGFNLLSAEHWRYLSELQVADAVDRKFYIFLAGFLIIGLFILYILIVPWHRKIQMSERPKDNTLRFDMYSKPVQQEPVVVSSGVPQYSFGEFQRPPKLNLNNSFIPTRQEMSEVNSVVAPSSIRQSVPENSVFISEGIHQIYNMLGAAGFTNKESPVIDGIKPDFYAVGSGETLMIGIYCPEVGDIIAEENGNAEWASSNRIFKSPVWQITTVIQKLNGLFLEVLDADLKVNIIPFVFVVGNIANKDAVMGFWDAAGIRVFSDAAEVSNFISSNMRQPQNEEEKNELSEFSDFVDTVTKYFANNV